MSDTEDYPGPSKDHPEKQGREGIENADENMVRPPARPEDDPKREAAEQQ
jgi:hypothetical protein